MVSAARFFVARTTTLDSGPCGQLQFPSLNSRCLHSGTTSSCSPPSSSSVLVGSSSLHKGKQKRTTFKMMTEGMLSRKEWRFQSKPGVTIDHGLGWNTSIDLQRLACVAHSNQRKCGRFGKGSGNVYWCSLVNVLKRGLSMAAHGEKERERERQRALFSFCAQAMVASHMAQSPLLSFLWASWPSMVNELCGKRRSLNLQEDGTRGHFHALVSYLSQWKVLLSGVILGALITMTLTSSASLGALLDSCFWLCLLCSFVFLAAFTIQAMFVAVMFVARGGVMRLCKSFNRLLQKNVCTGLSQGFFADVSTGRLWFTRCVKPQSSDFAFWFIKLMEQVNCKG